jgi:hypothetical protein
VKLEKVGGSGELTELPLSHINIPVTAPQTPSVVIHVYGGGVATTQPGMSVPGASIIHAAPSASIIHAPSASIIHKTEPAPEEEK